MKYSIELTEELLERLANEYRFRTVYGVPLRNLITFHEYVDSRIADMENSLAVAVVV